MRPRIGKTILLATGVVIELPARAHAAGAGLPWEPTFSQLVDSATGPVAKAIGVFAIIAAGAGFAFSENGSHLRKIFTLVGGLSIAFTAATLITSLFGFAGGAVIP